MTSWHNHFSIMEICKTDIKDILRYLADAADFYETHANGFAEKDRPRLLRNMARKIRKKFAETANGNINKP